MDKEELVERFHRLVDNLLIKQPVVTGEEILSKYLGADERRRVDIGNASIATMMEVSKAFLSKKFFKPFEGVYSVAVDERGKINFPPELKYIFDLQPVLTVIKKDWTLSLSLYPRNLYEALVYVPEVELDSYGRFYIPKYLREIAEIEKRAVVIGDYDQVIIANERKFREFLTK